MTKKSRQAQLKKNSKTVEQNFAKKIIKKKILLALIIGILTAFVLYLSRSLFIAAVVNGQPISRFAIIQELEKQLGKAALNSLIDKALIWQEAKKQGVTVSADELSQKMDEIVQTVKDQGQDLDTLLSTQGITKDEFKKQLKNQILVEKLLKEKIKVSEDEIDKFLEENKEILPKNKDKSALRKDVQERLVREKLANKYQEWIQDLRKKANISYWVSY